MSADSPIPAYEALLARIEGASGPDRGIDCAVVATLLPETRVMLGGVVMPVSEAGERWPITSKEYGPAGVTEDGIIAAYSASIDAALALVERKLPNKEGWSHSVWLVAGDYAHANARIWSDDADYHSRGSLTAPLAILSALLRALIEESRHDRD